MRKRLTSALAISSLAALLSVSFAGLPITSTIQNGATITEVHNGQTFEMTAVGITVEVTFYEVTPNEVDGEVTKVQGNSGTFTILWVEQNISSTIQLTPGQPEQLFGLEGGDGDKRNGEIIN